MAAFDEDATPLQLIEGKGMGKRSGCLSVCLCVLYVYICVCRGGRPSFLTSLDTQHAHDDVTELVLRIDEEEGEGAVLVFLPGWDDISALHQSLGQMPQVRVGRRRGVGRGQATGSRPNKFPSSIIIPHQTPQRQAARWRLYPLHSQLPMDQQREIFQPPPRGLRKVK